MKKIKNNTIEEWLQIKYIQENGNIKLKNNKYIKIIKINPINYNLKSDLEKKAILNSYKIFLKTCNFNIQILIQSKKEDLSSHINNIQENINKKENKYLEKIYLNYLEYIKKINSKNKSSSKDFYLIICSEKTKDDDYINSKDIIENELKEKYFKIKECLARCGNSVIEIQNKEDVIKIFYSFLNTRKYLNK